MQNPTEQTLQLSDKDIFLKELRAVTGPAHKKLEETPLSKAIVSPELSLNEYVLYLCKMKSVVDRFEKELFPLLKPVIKDIEQRHKSHWIDKDLYFLRDEQSPITIENFPVFASTSLPYALGCLYVLEGSTLGGKFIFKNVQSTLSLNDEQGASYFNGYGMNTGKMWVSFLEQFTDYAIHSPAQKEFIIQGANDMFRSMFDILNN